MLCVAGQQAEDWQRIEPRRILRTQLEGTRTGLPGLIPDCQAIGKKQQVEAAVFQGLGDFNVVVRVEKVAMGLRVTPHRVAMYHGAREHEPRQCHLLGHMVFLGYQSARSNMGVTSYGFFSSLAS